MSVERSTMRLAQAALIISAALTVTVTASGISSAATDTSSPDLLPLTVTNSSGSTAPVYIYNLGTQESTGLQGWVDVDGVFHAWPAGNGSTVQAPDASVAGPIQGQSKTIKIPDFSGRIYFSYGKKLVFNLDGKGALVQPDVQNATDPNRNTLFNWSEYTSDSKGFTLNSTQVDMFSAPYSVGIRKADGTNATAGILKPGGYSKFFASLQGLPGGWGGLIQKDGNGNILRAIAPSHGVETGVFSPEAMTQYIDKVFDKYSNEKLTVAPLLSNPNLKYTGQVSGNTMNFRDTAGKIVTSFNKPDADSVFGCYKDLDAPNDDLRGPISRTLCAGYNRGTLLAEADQPVTDTGKFYNTPASNLYSSSVHNQMTDGKAYGFAFDDVANQEALVSDSSPQSAFMVLEPMV